MPLNVNEYSRKDDHAGVSALTAHCHSPAAEEMLDAPPRMPHLSLKGKPRRGNGHNWRMLFSAGTNRVNSPEWFDLETGLGGISHLEKLNRHLEKP
jgi:hypothetical protein